jgi:hypothetical protein
MKSDMKGSMRRATRFAIGLLLYAVALPVLVGVSRASHLKPPAELHTFTLIKKLHRLVRLSTKGLV